MTRDILGRPYKPGRYWADGSRPLHARSSCQGDAKLTVTVTKVDPNCHNPTAEREPTEAQNGSPPHPCPWHFPSAHHMRKWPRVIRFDKYGLVERICSHGIGHPDPDSLAFVGMYIAAGPHPSLAIHGCDGDCNPEVTLCE